MKTFPPKSVFGLIFGLILMSGCAANSPNVNGNSNVKTAQNVNGSNANITKDDAEDLRQIIKLPFEPEEVVWREDAGNAAQTARKLTAVLRFTAPDTEKIVVQAAAAKPGTPAVIEAEMWFPAELIAQSQLSGDETLKGTTYAAPDFVQPPYTGGKLTRIENSDYFLLELN